jgi:hypothetical protein
MGPPEHRGIRRGLFVEVVRAVEAQQRALLDELRADPQDDTCLLVLSSLDPV